MISTLNKTLNLIIKSDKYLEFESKIAETETNKEKGDIQEIFAKIYFESHQKHYEISNYYSRLLDVIPENLGVHQRDVGTDAIIVHNDQTISLIQIKFRSDNKKPLIREHVSNMALEGLPLIKNGKLRFLYLFGNSFTSPTNISKIEKEHIRYILGDILSECNWELVRSYAQNYTKDQTEIKHIIVDLPPRRIWQKEAIEFVTTGGIDFEIKQVIAACGAGKTRFAYEILNTKIMAKTVSNDLSNRNKDDNSESDGLLDDK